MAICTMTLAACGDNIITDSRDIVFPAKDVSYRSHVQPLFDLSCAVSGCHDTYAYAGGLALTSYVELRAKPGVIVSNDSSGSLLVQVLRGRQPHINDALFRRVTEDQKRGIAVWVQEGAFNN
jgi:hypothetical protein